MNKLGYPNDLTGCTCGYYYVIGLAEPRVSPSGRKRKMWTCRCVCGTIKDVYDGHLKSRSDISCGCMKKTTLEDLTGKTFYSIFVENRAEGRPKGNGKFTTMWNCVCLACGKHFKAAASKIKSGKQKSCGCLNGYYKGKARFEDLTGKKIGRLLVESLFEKKTKKNGKHIPYWNCICDCGNKCIRTSEYLKGSTAPSCGCWKSEITSEQKFKDLSGQKIGMIYVKKRVPDKTTTGGNKVPQFLCLCNCGCEFITTANNIRNGITKSCGCIKSFGEKEIRDWLRKNNILFETEYYYDDLLSPNGYPLRFDFAIYDDPFQPPLFLLEYQGEQHYKDCGEFGKLEREITDKMKKEYCLAHGVSLHEIRYDENISDCLNKIVATYVNFVPSSNLEKV